MTMISSWSAWTHVDAKALTRYRCEITWDYSAVRASWAQLAGRGSALAFQQSRWLETWYETLGCGSDVTPLFATVVDADTGREVLGLPLVMRRIGGSKRIEFADGGLTDYNAPVLGSELSSDPAQARAIWKAIRRSLPDADLFVATKMPLKVAGRTNPLAAHRAARPCRLGGNVLHIPDRYEEWHFGLERTFRKELERSLRVFWRFPGASFRRIEAPAEVASVFAELKRMQSARIRELGLPYVLDEPRNEAFYNRLVQDGIADGSVILTALTTDDGVIAALLGIRSGSHYAMVRLAAAGGIWRTCSPGRLVIERTMHLLHGQGLRSFDFTIGDYDYKRRLGVTPQPLADLWMPLSWRGIVPAMRERLRGTLRNSTFVRNVIAFLRS